jgi:GTP-binding protein LepA
LKRKTLANTYLAIENNLELIPSSIKLTCPEQKPEKAIEQIEHFIGLETHNAVLTSAKTGEGVAEVLEAIVRDVPSPKGDESAPLKALIFDSWYDSYRGVIVLFRVIDGSIRTGMKIRFFNTGS